MARVALPGTSTAVAVRAETAAGPSPSMGIASGSARSTACGWFVQSRSVAESTRTLPVPEPTAAEKPSRKRSPAAGAEHPWPSRTSSTMIVWSSTLVTWKNVGAVPARNSPS